MLQSGRQQLLLAHGHTLVTRSTMMSGGVEPALKPSGPIQVLTGESGRTSPIQVELSPILILERPLALPSAHSILSQAISMSVSLVAERIQALMISGPVVTPSRSCYG